MSEQLRLEGLAKYITVKKPPPSVSRLPARNQVFLSYPPSQAQLARRIYGSLQDQGIEVWWDRDILPGSRWSDEIRSALEQSKVMVTILPPGVAASGQLDEIKYAMGLKRPVVPVLAEKAVWEDVPSVLRDINVLQMGESHEAQEDSLRKLRMGVEMLLRRSERPVEPADPEDPQKGRWGGTPKANDRELRAKVKELSSDWFEVMLEIVSTSSAPLTGEVRFHLHPTFSTPIQRVAPTNGNARLVLRAWGAFTVGAEADEGKTRLELDLSQDSRFPETFRQR